ncbi:uncharacterized protein LOC123566471 [Mercenaria mercenaria]|uniref:uncharacterized protein LOC123566471 n=1 Tax=Mercenaria mercenaria TaxID=6596 RepID=UPI00234F0EDB|nr:uncharacterized protein LOC123566471 [Mercenaria mercenaria]
MTDTSDLLDEIGSRICGGKNIKDFNLLYKAVDKADVRAFHDSCDAKGPTVTILYGKHNTLFGGYTSKDWSSNKNRKMKDEDAFLFSKKNNPGAKCIFLPIKKDKTSVAITCDASFGPTFGGGTFESYDLQAFKKGSKPASHIKDGFMHLNGSLNVNYAYSAERNPKYKENVQGLDRAENTDQQKIKSKDINSGQMIVKRIEVYQVVDDIQPKNWLPELKREDFIRKKKELTEIVPLPVLDIKRYTILLVGVIGSGKSSFVNTLSTVFTGKVAHIAPARNCSESVTSRVKPYVLKSENGDSLNIRIVDIRGFEDERGYENELDLLLDGKLPAGYQFPDNPEHVPEITETATTLDDEMHLVCFVNGNPNFETFTGDLHKRFGDIIKTISRKGLPMAVVATKFDQHCPTVSKDVNNIYSSRKAERTTSETAKFYGVPHNHVFPVVNYVSENERNDGIDRLALNALYEMLKLIQSYLGNHQDVVDKPDEWTKRGELLPALRNGNDKDLILQGIHEKLSELENKKLRILVVGPTYSGKSSFIDSVLSALQDDIDGKAEGACLASAQLDGVSSRETFELYPMRYKHESGRVIKSNVFFGDTPGFQEMEGISFDHVKYILRGNVPDKYKVAFVLKLDVYNHNYQAFH